ncbi:AMP-binding protein [Gordonia insulae]|uniref:Tyrocidine synthase 3 n=1 Tax=Gordonia insulae TaxID=2420509 RepID=A0A3G8JQP4_9ACTN|nr:AMP-binding protein [Gordonia insulae]AZG46829.1 Tyrocidine synthase 3 [Gordonia insulae]
MTTSFLVDTDVFGADLTTAAARWRAVAAARADATAVRTPEASLTFAETAAQADRRAQQIVGMTEAGRPIAISIESDTDTVVSMLAVLCSGRPLVLLDPFLPADRRERVLRLSGAHLWEPLDADVDPGGTVSGAPEPAPDDPAVLLFTSGSTGTPKGAVLSQRMPVNHARDGRHFMNFGPEDRAAVLLPLSFGGGLDALAMSLLNGATVLLWDVRRRTTSGLRDWLAAERATTVHSTPSLLRSWLGELTADDAVDSVRLLSTCGEPTHHTDVLLTRETLMPHGMFCSGAGASEVGNLAFNLLSPEQEIEAGPVPVGLPASDKHIRIVDEDGADLPAGTTGEVLVESAHIASGYHDDPEQTATVSRNSPTAGPVIAQATSAGSTRAADSTCSGDSTTPSRSAGTWSNPSRSKQRSAPCPGPSTRSSPPIPTPDD